MILSYLFRVSIVATQLVYVLKPTCASYNPHRTGTCMKPLPVRVGKLPRREVMATASIAPMKQLIRFTSSFVSHGKFCDWKVAPIYDSQKLAMNAETIVAMNPSNESMRPAVVAMEARRIEPTTPATVPSRLTAPSVPLGTRFKVVIRYLKEMRIDKGKRKRERGRGKIDEGKSIMHAILYA